MKLLEVIVTSVDEACEAEQGGADRLELVSDFASEGLTPKLSIVERVLRVVSIPVRVMLRENESFEIKDDDELELLKKYAAELGSMPVNGVVLGFVNNNEVNSAVMNQLLACSGTKPATFHRAIESLSDQDSAVAEIPNASPSGSHIDKWWNWRLVRPAQRTRTPAETGRTGDCDCDRWRIGRTRAGIACRFDGAE